MIAGDRELDIPNTHKQILNYSFNLHFEIKALVQLIRSSRSQMLFKTGVLENFINFTGKHLCWSLFLINFQTFRPATLLKRDSNTSVFLWNLWNFKNAFFSQNSYGGCFLLSPRSLFRILSKIYDGAFCNYLKKMILWILILQRQLHKTVKHNQTIRELFDQFVRLMLKRLILQRQWILIVLILACSRTNQQNV